MSRNAHPTIDLTKVSRIIVKARQFDGKEGAVDGASGSAIDDGFRDVLADTADDPVYKELRSFIRELDVDEQCELVALMWSGRGDFDSGEWSEALKLAYQEHNARTAEYLLGTPMLADYLVEGLAKFGRSARDFENEHL